MPWDPVDLANHTIDMAVHAALIPGGTHGKILYFGGYYVNDTHLFDVSSPHVIEAAPSLPGYNIFCSGHAFLADGRLLVAGGQLELEGAPPPHAPPPPGVPIVHLHGNMSWGGERRCTIFHPLGLTWTETGPLNLDPLGNANSGGRWYPTLCTLDDGDVLAVGGHPDLRETYPVATVEDARHNNNTPERYSVGGGTWTMWASHPPAESQLTAHQFGDDYQRTHLLPNGNVFFASPVRGKNRVFDPAAGVFLASPEIEPPWDDDPNPAQFYRNISAAYTSVMLPLLHEEGYRPRVLLMGGKAPKRIDLGDLGSAQWASAGGRGLSERRYFVSPVILPTGEIFFTGGTDADQEGEDAQQMCVLQGEIYDPGVDWASGTYTSETGGWETVESATVRRHYHGIAILMPNGAVWTAGSNGPSEAGLDPDENRELRWEIFRPWYFAETRPVIGQCPANIGYGYSFQIKVPSPQANTINRVALLRCGSVTHGFNPDQRYITVPHEKINSTTLEVTVPYMPEVLPPGRYLLWIVDQNNRPCEWASFIRISKQKELISAEVSTYSQQEVEALGHPAVFNQALFVVFDGFLPDEVVPPTPSFFWKGTSTSVPGVSAVFGTPKYEAGVQAKDIAQRIVFPVHITFHEDSEQAFAAIPAGEDFRDFVFRATMRSFSAEATLTLSKNLNPRMNDGDPPWLSVDLRAFSTKPNDPPFTANVPHGAGLNAPYDYIKAVLVAYDTWPANQPHPFDSLPTNQETNKLPLYSHDASNRPVFNYAVARVRMRAPEGMQAPNVRVFFRLWTTGWTALTYSTNEATGSYPRHGDGANAAPLLGLYGGEINTIPCFAEPRESNLEAQKDPTNLKPIIGAGATEVHTYFGCWLDFNQDVLRFPLMPSAGDHGPYTTDLRSIQQLMRGPHQCLVAEIHYWPDDPIPEGTTPALNDSLAQRNLLLDESDNPGGFASHLVHHTFEVKPSPLPFPPATTVAPSAAATLVAARLHPDEVVIDWGNLPRDSHVTFYMPQIDVDEVLRFAARRQGPALLSKAGDHAIRCKVTDVGFIPIPGPLAKTIAGLISVQLPPNLTAGQKFSLVLRQVDGRKLRVVGATQFDIRVKMAAQILPGMERNLAVLKHIALSIPPANRWYPIFERYLSELGDRVRALGGDPDGVGPSPTGGREPDRPPEEDGRREVGKIAELVYDCFGDFEGFVLETCTDRHVFRACEKAMEEVIRRACKERMKVTVIPHPKESQRPLRIILHCCGI